MEWHSGLRLNSTGLDIMVHRCRSGYSSWENLETIQPLQESLCSDFPILIIPIPVRYAGCMLYVLNLIFQLFRIVRRSIINGLDAWGRLIILTIIKKKREGARTNRIKSAILQECLKTDTSHEALISCSSTLGRRPYRLLLVGHWPSECQVQFLTRIPLIGSKYAPRMTHCIWWERVPSAKAFLWFKG